MHETRIHCFEHRRAAYRPCLLAGLSHYGDIHAILFPTGAGCRASRTGRRRADG